MVRNNLSHPGRASVCALFILLLASCRQQAQRLSFTKYPDLQIGFSTQNFQKALPVNVASLTDFIDYASTEGYQFIELRDNLATLTREECLQLANHAKDKKIDVIYEVQVNPLDTVFLKVFDRALANTLLFPGPGILRSLVSQSEFDADSTKKGWSKDELNRLAHLLDSCAAVAKAKKVQLIVENLNEPFFGDSSATAPTPVYGLSNLFASTTIVGLQFDIGNAFRNSSRRKADPAQVGQWLPTLGPRWVTSHLKTLQQGASQPFLTDNPMPVEEVIRLMGEQHVKYATIELLPVTDKQACYDNHAKSIRFLKEKGILVN
jgi:sugar phosphate isomerase/epimerase